MNEQNIRSADDLKAADAEDQGALKAIESVGDRIEGKPTTIVDAQADIRMEIAWNDGAEDTDSVPPQTAPD